VWLRRSLAVAFAAAFLTGCSRNSKTYGAPEVADALRNHGFHVGVVAQSDLEQNAQQVFPQVVPEGVQSMVAEWEQRPYPNGGTRGAVILSALIFETQRKASCGESNLIGTCLQRRNIVVVVRNNRANAVREALDDLG
jgi:hypothetical protein